MTEPNSPSLPFSNLNSNVETRSERGHGYFHRIFKFGRKKDKLSDSEPIAGYPESMPQIDNPQNASQQHHSGDRKRVKSLNKSRSRMAISATPRSAKLFALAGRKHMRFLKKTTIDDRKSKQADADHRDAQELFAESFPSPSSVILTEDEAAALAKIRRKRVSLRAIRHTQGNSTIIFAKDGKLSSPRSLPASEKTMSKTQDDLCLNSSREEKQAFAGLRTKSLLDISSWPSVKEQRAHSAIHSGVTYVKPERGDSGNHGLEVISVRSDGISSDSLDINTSGGSRIFSFRCLFREPGSQDQKITSSHASLRSGSDKRLQMPPKDETNRLLMRRSSSLPQNIRTRAAKGASNSRSKRLASSDDGLQCPWGVKATKEKSESLILRNNAPLTFRIPDISSALNFAGKRGNSTSSASINLSEDDYERSEPDDEKNDSKVEMQQDDFIEYTVKLAKKQRK